MPLNPLNAVVTGAASGLGRLIAAKLEMAGVRVIRYDLHFMTEFAGFVSGDVRSPEATNLLARVEEEFDGRLDLLVNCAGVNKINWLDDVARHEWEEVMDINAYGPFRMTQYLHGPLRAADGVVCNIVSNAAHMPMRCSAAYNASKAAALMVSKQLARELVDEGITVFSVSPNKLSGTGMSRSIDEQVCRTRGWSREEAQAYQINGLLTKEETSPHRCADFVAGLLLDRTVNRPLAGCDLPYGL